MLEWKTVAVDVASAFLAKQAKLRSATSSASMGFELVKEGSLEQFLGIKLEPNRREGSIELMQNGLIFTIISVSGHGSCEPNMARVSQLDLGCDDDG
jgi:hypothetical protein